MTPIDHNQADRLLRLDEASDLLGCHVETLRLRVRLGELQARRRPGGAYLVDFLDVLKIKLTLRARTRRRRSTPPSRAEVEASWDAVDRYLCRHRAHRAAMDRFIAELRANPEANRKLYRLISVHRLMSIGLGFEQIAAELSISSRQARRLSRRDPHWAALHGLFGATTRNLRKARALVGNLRAGLEGTGFQRQIMPGRRLQHAFRPGQPRPWPSRSRSWSTTRSGRSARRGCLTMNSGPSRSWGWALMRSTT